jgi:hypothetical protein
MVALSQYQFHDVDLDNARAARPTALEVFIIHCWARARLWAEGELSLHEAVDVLQELAERAGLVALIGQDAVQAILAAEFGAGQC